MVVYNTESACVFRDFLITFFLLRASSYIFGSGTPRGALTETGEEIFILASRKLLARFL